MLDNTSSSKTALSLLPKDKPLATILFDDQIEDARRAIFETIKPKELQDHV